MNDRTRGDRGLEPVPKKLIGFFDQNVLQLFESENLSGSFSVR